MPKGFLHLVADQNARHRVITWKPLLYGLLIFGALFFTYQSGQSGQHDANKAQSAAYQQCRVLAAGRRDGNTHVRQPLKQFGVAMATAQQKELALLLPTLNAKGQTDAGRKFLTAFTSIQNEILMAAQHLGAQVTVPPEITCTPS